MKADQYIPRFITSRLEETLSDTPVVLIHGPRQSGKTTLASMIGKELGYRYMTFDDDVMVHAAQEDPVGFIDSLPERVILDEVQRVPDLFRAIKRTVDNDRKPGRFLLTGSANVLALPKLADTLTGRMAIVRLYPFAQSELNGSRSTFVEDLFGSNLGQYLGERLRESLVERVVAGGYPAALSRNSDSRRRAWYRDYVETTVQRDIRDLSRISSVDIVPRLLRAAAGQTASVMNLTDLSNPFQLSRQTITDYIVLLRQVFLLDELPAWHTNRLKRLTRTAKLHFGDTGMAAALLGATGASLPDDQVLRGKFVETFVFQELRRLISWADDDYQLYHLRDRDQVEVDIVIERSDGKIAGIEVKSGATVRSQDFRGIRKLASAMETKFASGVVLYDGEATVPFGRNLHAVPLRAFWE